MKKPFYRLLQELYIIGNVTKPSQNQKETSTIELIPIGSKHPSFSFAR